MISNAWARTATLVFGLGAIAWTMVQDEPPPIEIHTIDEPVEVQVRESAPPIAALQDATYVWTNTIRERLWQQKAAETVTLTSGIAAHPKYAPPAEKLVFDSPMQLLVSPPPRAPQSRAPRATPKVVGRLEKKSIHELAQDLGLSERMTARLEKNPKARVEIEKLKSYGDSTLSAAARRAISEIVGLPQELVFTSADTGEAPQSIQDVTLSGDIEIDGGLAYIGGKDSFHIYREHFGVPQEEGFVKISEGFYKINVAEGVGSVVALLFDENGNPKGQGSLLLSSLSPDQVQNGRLDGPKIVIQPLQNGASAKVLSSYSFASHEMPVEKSVVSFSAQEDLFELEGTDFRIEELDNGSSFQLMAGAPDHWGTMVIAHTESQSRLELFSDSYMEALLDIAGVPVSQRGSVAVVFGRVTEGANPKAGAVVELASQTVQPIYFNKLMIADKSMTSTASNGLYAFIDVAPGLHVVRASADGEAYPPEVFTADINNVSNVNIEKGEKAWVPMAVYDPLRQNDSLSSEVQIVGEAAAVGVVGESLYPLQQNESLMWLESFPEGGYTPARIAKTRKSESLLIPSVSENWLSRLKETLREETQRESPIVGYVSGGDELETYQVFLGTDAKSDEYEVVYFDASGERSETAQPNGGFAVFGAEKGMQTVVIVPNAPLKASTHLVIADSETVSLVQHFY